MLIATSSKSG